MADTLRGVQIYFNPWCKDVHSDMIQACVWDNINVGANTEHVLYKQKAAYILNIDSINGFATYFFDVPQPVSGTIYVGLQQNTADLIGVGVDVNTNSGSNMFISFNNQWQLSNIGASWMIRPFFGKDFRVGIDERTSQKEQFEIFPNPAGNELWVAGNGSWVGRSIEIYNVLGEKVYYSQHTIQGSQPKTRINISKLPGGVYFVKVSDAKGGSGLVKRLIVQH